MDVPHGDSRTWIYAGVGRASGMGLVQATTVTSTELPTILCHTTSTAEVTPLANLSGEPPRTRSLLLLSRSDFRALRLGLCGVRPVLLGNVEALLQYGRTGRFRLFHPPPFGTSSIVILPRACCPSGAVRPHPRAAGCRRHQRGLRLASMQLEWCGDHLQEVAVCEAERALSQS